MNTDTAAHGRKGIPFPDDINGLLVFSHGYGRNIIGDVDAGRTCMLARGDDHGIARGPGTAML